MKTTKNIEIAKLVLPNLILVSPETSTPDDLVRGAFEIADAWDTFLAELEANAIAAEKKAQDLQNVEKAKNTDWEYRMGMAACRAQYDRDMDRTWDKALTMNLAFDDVRRRAAEAQQKTDAATAEIEASRQARKDAKRAQKLAAVSNAVTRLVATHGVKK